MEHTDNDGSPGGARMRKIETVSRRFRPVFLTLAVLLPAGICAYWLLHPWLPPTMRAPGRAAYLIAVEPGLTTRLIAMVIHLPAALLGAAAAWTMARLMRLYQRGGVFTRETVHCFLLVGRFLLLATIANILARPFLSVALTWHNPPGQKALSITFGSADLSGLIAGGILLLIAWVMEEGRALEEEQRFTV